MKKFFITLTLITFSALFFSCKASAEKDINFVVISDIHLNTAKTRPMEITPHAPHHDNDLDPITFNYLLSSIALQIKNLHIPQPQFIIVLGDIVGHLRSQKDSAINSETEVFTALKNYFPHTPIFYVFGNNDSLKTNYGPFKDDTQPNYQSPYDVAKKTGWLNGFLSTGTVCEKNTFPCLITEDTTHGYYAAYLQPSLRLLALNSVMFSSKHSGVTKQDAEQQLKWLEAQLEAVQNNNETALIALHISPGVNVFNDTPFWTANDGATFLNIINQYRSHIIGILAGHTHAEELKVLQNTDKQESVGVFLTAALSTAHGNSPAIKSFTLTHENKWQIADYETFHFTMLDKQITFNSLYHFRHHYCQQDNETFAMCLQHVDAEKMKKYFSAGNPYYGGTMTAPAGIFLK